MLTYSNYFLLTLILLLGCSKQRGHKSYEEREKCENPVFIDDLVFRSDGVLLIVTNDNLDRVTVRSTKQPLEVGVKAIVKILEKTGEVMGRDSFARDGNLIYSISSKGSKRKRISYDQLGRPDTSFQLLDLKVSTSRSKLVWKEKEVHEYYSKGDTIYQFTYRIKDGKREVDYSRVREFLDENRQLSQTYHWSYGAGGEHHRYYYSNEGYNLIDSVQLYRGTRYWFSKIYHRSKNQLGYIETVVEANGDTLSVSFYSMPNKLTRLISYSKPNPDQKYSYKRGYRYEYEYY